MRAVDLFAGCGGLSRGFQGAGFELVLAIEKWAPARDAYEQNFDHPIQNIDLSDVVTSVRRIKKERPSIIIGGPPCQDYSQAGMRIESDRAQLTVSFAEIINILRPKWFVMENVREARKSVSWCSARHLLAAAGYGITECVLDAAQYGVPQHRKRFFAVGCLGESDNFLLDEILDGASSTPTTVRDYLGDEFGIENYYRHPRTWGRRGVYSIDEPSPTIRTTNRPVPPGYTRHKDDAADFRTVRALTPDERARIQTFDRDFKLPGSTSQRDTFVANAVPVLLARHVAEAIVGFEKIGGSDRSEHTFRTWLADTHHYTPRTAGNVVSRLNRAARILKTSSFGADALEPIHALERKREYQELGSAVRSHIKKALKLRAEFRSRDGG